MELPRLPARGGAPRSRGTLHRGYRADSGPEPDVVKTRLHRGRCHAPETGLLREQPLSGRPAQPRSRPVSAANGRRCTGHGANHRQVTAGPLRGSTVTGPPSTFSPGSRGPFWQAFPAGTASAGTTRRFWESGRAIGPRGAAGSVEDAQAWKQGSDLAEPSRTTHFRHGRGHHRQMDGSLVRPGTADGFLAVSASTTV